MPHQILQTNCDQVSISVAAKCVVNAVSATNGDLSLGIAMETTAAAASASVWTGAASLTREAGCEDTDGKSSRN